MEENYNNAMKLLRYAVEKGSALEAWKICNTVLHILGEEGSVGKVDQKFVEKIINDRK